MVCSSGQAAANPRSFVTTATTAGNLNSAYHGFTLALAPLPPGANYKLYGVTIRYEA